MKLEIGKLYQSTEDHILLFDTSFNAVSAVEAEAVYNSRFASCGSADYWSYELSCCVSYVAQNGVFMVLDTVDPGNRANVHYKVLAGEKIGWINNHHSMNIEELVA